MKRRHFIKNTSAALSYGALVAPFSGISATSTAKPIGVCLVGLGIYSRDLLAPALQLTQHCKLTGIVTGTPAKIPVWQKMYNIPDKNVYNYNSIHQIADNPDIDVIYIVLPTGLHAEYAIKAAETGKHVWCEKPMAKTVAECESIIKACNANKVKLSIGYRMQHEPNTQQVIKWSQEKPYGTIKSLKAEAGYFDPNPLNSGWRLNKKLGGGPIYDMGVYPINALRYASGMEPIAVTAKHSTKRDDVYTEVAETTNFQLEFPDGITAEGGTTTGENVNILRIDCEKGWYELSPFQSYTGVKGKTSDGKILEAHKRNQQAQQMDDDALAIQNNTTVMVPGKNGLNDIAIVEAINASAAQNGKRITLSL